MSDITAHEWAVDECRRKQNLYVYWAREEARKVRQLENALKTLRLAACIEK